MKKIRDRKYGEVAKMVQAYMIMGFSTIGLSD